jgi:hypothetical protein
MLLVTEGVAVMIALPDLACLFSRRCRVAVVGWLLLRCSSGGDASLSTALMSMRG